MSADMLARARSEKLAAICGAIYLHDIGLGGAQLQLLALLDEVAEEARAAALAWTDEDQSLPEDDAITAAHPAYSDKHHNLYTEAMRMVGAKRSKGALVGLVCWLLVRAEEARAAERKACAEFVSDRARTWELIVRTTEVPADQADVYMHGVAAGIRARGGK